MNFATERINYAIEWQNRLDAIVNKSLPEGSRVTDQNFKEAAYKAYPG